MSTHTVVYENTQRATHTQTLRNMHTTHKLADKKHTDRHIGKDTHTQTHTHTQVHLHAHTHTHAHTKNHTHTFRLTRHPASSYLPLLECSEHGRR